jgi:hypothetical protein
MPKSTIKSTTINRACRVSGGDFRRVKVVDLFSRSDVRARVTTKSQKTPLRLRFRPMKARDDRKATEYD